MEFDELYDYTNHYDGQLANELQRYHLEDDND
jgi:hypothetical protein